MKRKRTETDKDFFPQSSPEFVIALIRTPHLPPRFAQFYVPLEFNKLDMRDYMKRAYGVKVLTIRSFVEQQKVTRERKFGKPGYGPLRRPKSKKKMTIEMTEPFSWPEPPKSGEEYVLFFFFLSLVPNSLRSLGFWERRVY